MRQRRLQFSQFLLHAFNNFLRIGTRQPQHQALDGLALAVLRHHSIARDGADLDLGQITDADRGTILHRHHDRTQIVQIRNTALAAHQQHFVAFAEPTGTVVAVVGVNHLPELRHGHAAGGHFELIGHHLEGANNPAQRIHVGHARHSAQRRPDHPVEQAAPFGQRQSLAFDGEHIHFPERGRDGRHAARDAGGQAFAQAAQTFADLLARPIDIGAVLEVDRHVDQAVLGDRTQDLGFRDAEHFHFDRHRDTAFDFLRRHAGGLHDDFDLGARHVGECVNRQAEVGHPSRTGDNQCRQQNEQAL